MKQGRRTLLPCFFYRCKSLKDFRKKVIEVAVREINEKSDILLYPHYKKSGRAITSISFEIHINYEKQK